MDAFAFDVSCLRSVLQPCLFLITSLMRPFNVSATFEKSNTNMIAFQIIKQKKPTVSKNNVTFSISASPKKKRITDWQLEYNLTGGPPSANGCCFFDLSLLLPLYLCCSSSSLVTLSPVFLLPLVCTLPLYLTLSLTIRVLSSLLIPCVCPLIVLFARSLFSSSAFCL